MNKRFSVRHFGSVVVNGWTALQSSSPLPSSALRSPKTKRQAKVVDRRSTHFRVVSSLQFNAEDSLTVPLDSA